MQISLRTMPASSRYFLNYSKFSKSTAERIRRNMFLVCIDNSLTCSHIGSKMLRPVVLDYFSRTLCTALRLNSTECRALVSLPQCESFVPNLSAADANPTCEQKCDQLTNSTDSPLPPPQPVPRCLRESFNVAPFVRRSATLRQLVALGVDVHKWEKSADLLRMAVMLDFERDVAPLVQWLLKIKFPAEHIAPFLTANPGIMHEHRDDLEVRLRYLRWKRFSDTDIASLLARSPVWLSTPVKEVDARLGYFQKRFSLTPHQLRATCARYPKLFLSCLQKLEIKRFTFREEFGFSGDQIRELVVARPKAFLLAQQSLQTRLDFTLFRMKLSRERLVASESALLLCRVARVRPRHLFLQLLQRDQYNPTRPGFVKPDLLACVNDDHFCRHMARVPLATYSQFLKTF